MAKLDDGTEIDDEIALLAAKMSVDPKTRKGFLKLAKQIDPNLPIPEIEVEASVEAATAPLKAEIETLKANNAKNDAFQAIVAKRKPLKDKGISDAEIDRIEKVMVEKGILNHETALDYIRANEKLAAPTEAPGARAAVTLPEVVSKEFFKDPNKEARKVAASVLAETRAGKTA